MKNLKDGICDFLDDHGEAIVGLAACGLVFAGSMIAAKKVLSNAYIDGVYSEVMAESIRDNCTPKAIKSFAHRGGDGNLYQMNVCAKLLDSNESRGYKF